MNKKYSKCFTSIVNLTPKMAKELLDNQIEGQRKPAKRTVNQYADAMKRGLWLFSGVPIIIDWFGRMIDGQQRCLGVIKSETTTKILIVYGIDPKVFLVLDKGKRRGICDDFTINGEISCRVLAAAIRLCLLHKERKNLQGAGDGAFVQSADALAYLDNNPSMRESVQVGNRTGRIVKPAVGAFLHQLFSEINKSAADAFFDALLTGENMTAKSPILALRNFLLYRRAQRKSLSDEKSTYQVSWLIMAWNAHREGRSLTQAKLDSWRKKDPKEPIPQPI